MGAIFSAAEVMFDEWFSEFMHGIWEQRSDITEDAKVGVRKERRTEHRGCKAWGFL